MGRQRERLSIDDAKILGLESTAIMGHTAKLIVLEPEAGQALGIEALRARVGERVERVPRLSERAERPRFGHPAWVASEAPDLAWHVRDALGGGSAALSRAGFRALAGELMGERLDHTRPLWRIDGAALEGGRTGLVVRIHHAMADGISALRVLSEILWDPSEQEEQPHAGGGHAAERSPGNARRSTLARLPGALRRELRPGADTALDRHIGPNREVAWRMVPLERLKRIEHGAGQGVTVNDVVLATVAGGLCEWLDSGPRPASVRVQVPVSLHVRSEAAGALGNHDSFLYVDLPLSEPDCGARLRQINDETKERKLEHDAETLYSFFHALGYFKPLYTGVTRLASSPREFALAVSNVPGPRRRRTLLGHRVAEFCSFAEPANRHALRVAVVSFGGQLAFGLCADPDAVSGLERLADGLDHALDELDELVAESS